MVQAPAPSTLKTAGAILGVLVLIVVVLYLIRRRMHSGDDDGEDSGQQRVDDSQQARTRERPSLGMRQRAAGLTWPAKVLAVGTLVVLGVIIWNIYTYLKTGSPTQMAYARETQLAIVGGATFVVGAWWARKQRRSEGIVDIEYEPVPGSGRSETTTERLYFNTDDVVQTEDGLVVHEYTDGRFMKAYRQPKRVADDRRLRGDEHVRRPLSDKIGHRIPEHAEEVADNHWVFRTKGQRTARSPEMVADYDYLPPYSMSQERKLQIEQDVEEMASRVDQTQRKLAHKDEMIRELETMLENARTENWRDLIEVLQKVAPLVGSGYSNQRVLQKLPEGTFQAHSSRDQDAPATNGEYSADGHPGSAAPGQGGGGRD